MLGDTFLGLVCWALNLHPDEGLQPVIQTSMFELI